MAYKKCKYLQVAPTASGRVIVRADKAYKCGIEIPEIKLPASVRLYEWPPRKSWVDKDACAGCSFFEVEK